MKGNPAFRTLAAVAVALVGTLAAILVGAPPAAALMGLLAGAIAYALAPSTRYERALRAPEILPGAAGGQELPGLAELLRAVDEPILVVRDRRVIAVNEPARELLGAHIEGVDVRLAIRHPAAAELLAGTGADGDPAPRRTDLVGLGNAERQWQLTVTELPDGSRLVRLSDQSQARATEQMRADFVANASHELRTPLATLIGFLETLQDEEAAGDPETRGRFIRIMSDEATRMRNLVDDLMSLSRIEAERFTVPRDPVDLVPLIEEVKEGLKPLIVERGSAVEIDKRLDAAIVPGDRPQLAQMLNNLLVNALKYGRSGAPVRLRLEPAGDELLRLSVIDEGEGIAPEHLPRLTERFYRVDPGRSRSIGGTGLGLAIVKHIVLRHQGRLDIRSTPGKGTAVRVYLPRVTEDK